MFNKLHIIGLYIFIMEIAFKIFNKKYHHVRMRPENGITKLILSICRVNAY